ncbi:hypothetical protein QE152_g23664 [Popillia japonica]|uniref:Transposase n=1 Tax=Popillia japonica TaxID=7064 RepID=A0AAW1KG33_POPJA
MHYGLTHKKARELAYRYAKRLGLTYPKQWDENNEAGREWLIGFLHRDTTLSLRRPEATSLSRATSFNQHNVSMFYSKLKLLLEKYEFSSSIYDKIKEYDVPFDGGLSTLSKVLKNMGFRWKKSADKKAVLMESYDIRLKRIKYLKELHRYVQDNRPIIFTDESYIHSSHTQSKEWADDTTRGLKKPMSKGKRLIMVHAGGKAGFIPNRMMMIMSHMKNFHQTKKMLVMLLLKP